MMCHVYVAFQLIGINKAEYIQITDQQKPKFSDSCLSVVYSHVEKSTKSYIYIK